MSRRATSAVAFRTRGRGAARRRRPAALLVALLLGLVAATGCAEKIVLPEDRQPFVYLVLNQTVGLTGEPVQPAVVLTVWSADSVSYLSAERFEMRRASDDSLFDWRNASLFAVEPTFDLGSGLRPREANYLLASEATESFFQDSTARGLRREDLEPGETYDLLVDTGEEVIRGEATIPDTFRVSFPGGRRIAWPEVENAAGYRLTFIDHDDVFFLSDTAFTVPEDLTFGPFFLHALGPNVFRYLTEDDRRRAGIDAGTGVFGAIQAARPPPGAATADAKAAGGEIVPPR